MKHPRPGSPLKSAGYIGKVDLKTITVGKTAVKMKRNKGNLWLVTREGLLPRTKPHLPLLSQKKVTLNPSKDLPLKAGTDRIDLSLNLLQVTLRRELGSDTKEGGRMIPKNKTIKDLKARNPRHDLPGSENRVQIPS
jgi:hypothetical protein